MQLVASPVEQSGEQRVQNFLSKGDLRRALDGEIEALLTSLARVRHRRNELASISVLPPEVLLKVFAQLSLDWAPHKGNGSRGESSFILGWIRVTHVCRHWRDVALLAPTLWGDVKIESYSGPWIEEIVRRSGTAPLSLAVSSYVPQAGPSRTTGSPDIAFIKPHLPRIRSLSVSGPDLTTSLGYVLSMPALESLTLKQETRLSFLELPAHMLPPSYAPYLKQLTLVNCKFQTLPAVFTSLTSLSITFDVFDHAHLPPNFDEHLIAILEGTPYLEDLSLHDAFPPGLNDDGRVLRLPSTLKTLTLEAAYRFVPGCIQFAKAAIPRGSLRTFLTLLTSPDHQPVIEGLVSRILGPENPPTAVSLTFHSPYHVVFTGWRSTWTSSPSFLSSAPPADFCIADNRTQTYSCVKDVSYGAYLKEVRELIMQDQNCGMQIPAEQWIPAFARARQVRTLVIRGRPASLLETLVQTSDGASGEKEPLLFPRLEMLVLSFRDSDLWDVLVTPGELFERLEECLKVRRECGWPVRELRLPRGWKDIQSVRKIERDKVVEKLGFLNEGYA